MVDAIKAIQQGLTPRLLESATHTQEDVDLLASRFGYSKRDLRELCVRWGLLPDYEGLTDGDLPLLYQCFDARQSEDSHRSEFSDQNLARKFHCSASTIKRKRQDYIGVTQP